MPTSIEWVKNPDGTQGITVNSKTGCRNHDDGLCKGGRFPCYAYRLAHERLKSVYLANPNTIASQIINDTPLNTMQKQVKAELDPFYPRFWQDRLATVRQISKPTGIFLDDMSDWMGEYWPREWTEMELQLMRDCPQHRFYTLTKQPQQLPQWSPFPENCWVGVTATNGRMVDDAGYWLERIDAKVKYLSLEPLLEPIQVYFGKPGISWLIIGACTGTREEIFRLCNVCDGYTELVPKSGVKWSAQPKLEWLSEIVHAADKAGVLVFLKNNLNPLIHEDAISGQYALDTGLLTWEGKLRQEVP
jgi:protein gp37